MNSDDQIEIKILLDSARICVAKAYRILTKYEVENRENAKKFDDLLKGGDKK